MLLPLPNQDTTSWNAIILGYPHEEKDYQVFNCFAIIQKEGLSPNAMTLICILKSCGNIEGIVDSEYVCQVGSLQNLIKCFKSFLFEI